METFERLEAEWAEWNDLDPAGMCACASGSAALLLALEGLQLPQGSQVIQPDFSMIAVPRATVMAGLEPVFVDCDDDLLMSTYGLVSNEPRHAILDQAVCGETAVFLLVHVYGRRWKFPTGWNGFFSSRFVVEDLAEAHGVRPHERTDAACWSFFRNKVVAGEEGGAVWFRDPERAALARELRCLGFTAKHDFFHTPRGWNHRMSNAHADLILENLANYASNVNQRRLAENAYDRCCPTRWKMPPRNAPWIYDLKMPEGTGWGDLDRIVAGLNKEGIAARYGFKPMSLQEEFKNCRLVTTEKGKSVALEMSKRVLYLPLTPGTVTEESARRAFEVIERCLAVG